MGQVIQRLEMVLQYYNYTPGVGNTTAALEGFLGLEDKYHQNTFVTASDDQADKLARKYLHKKKCFTSISRLPDALLGRRGVLVIDHFAWIVLIQDAIREQQECFEQNIKFLRLASAPFVPWGDSEISEREGDACASVVKKS